MDQNQTNQSASSPEPTINVNNHTLLGVLSYLGPLVIVSFLMGKDIHFVKFHVKQGLVLLAIEIIVSILGQLSISLWMLLNLVNLAVLVLSIIGIVNVVQHKEKELPLVGGLAKHFKF